jgi:hypothetical protein
MNPSGGDSLFFAKLRICIAKTKNKFKKKMFTSCSGKKT